MAWSSALDLSETRVRHGVYASLAVLLLLVSILLATVWAEIHRQPVNWILSDGRFYWVYLPSVVIDHRLDIRNEVVKNWPLRLRAETLSRLTSRGYVRDKYTIGEALTLAPAFLVAHGLARGLYPLTGWSWLRPNGYSLVYQGLCVAWVLALGLLSMILIDHWLTAIVGLPAPSVLAAVLLLWLGTHYLWYFVFEPFMVHVVSTFWICCVVWLGGLAGLKGRWSVPRAWFPGALGLALAMAIVCRPTNAFILPVAFLGFFHWLRSARGRDLPRALPGLALAASPLAAQMLLWYLTTGTPLYYSYGKERFFFLHPALWQTLFSLRHGLFLWTPMLLVGVWGLLRHRDLWPRGQRASLAALAAGGVALWYLNSSWHVWWFGWAFGGRAFLELFPLFVAGTVLALMPFREARAGSRRRLVALISVLLCFHFALLALYALQIVPPDGDFSSRKPVTVGSVASARQPPIALARNRPTGASPRREALRSGSEPQARLPGSSASPDGDSPRRSHAATTYQTAWTGITTVTP